MLAPSLATPADARVPRGFVGWMWTGRSSTAASTSPRSLGDSKAGAQSVRWTIHWPEIQHYRPLAEVPAERRTRQDLGGIPTDLRVADRFVTAAARARLTPLPVLMRAAPWAAEDPRAPFSPPADSAAFARFAGCSLRATGAAVPFGVRIGRFGAVPLLRGRSGMSRRVRTGLERLPFSGRQPATPCVFTLTSWPPQDAACARRTRGQASC